MSLRRPKRVFKELTSEENDGMLLPVRSPARCISLFFNELPGLYQQEATARLGLCSVSFREVSSPKEAL
jgi:hypothetical protein